MSRCIWALLSSNNFDFIATSHYNQLNRMSLFQLIHPDEVALAKDDFARFLNANAHGGSVTRCRLRDYSKPDFMLPSMSISEDWLVVDLVMYIASNDIILAFFHPIHKRDTHSHSTSSLCGDYTDFHIEACLSSLKESVCEQQQNQQNSQRLRSPSLSSSSSLSSTNSESQQQQQPLQQQYDAISSQSTNFFDQQLHIIDNRTRSLLISIPQSHPCERSNNVNLNDLLIDRPSLSPGYSCFRFIQMPLRSDAFGLQVNRLLIDYGPISFLLVRTNKKRTTCLVSSISETLSSNKLSNKRHNDAPSSKRPPSKYRRRSVTPSSMHLYSEADQQNTPHYYKSPPPSTTTTLHSNDPQHAQFAPRIAFKNAMYGNAGNYCHNCGTSSSPEWRKGPSGHKTLCNACGLRYSRSLARQARMITNTSNDLDEKATRKPYGQHELVERQPRYHRHLLSSYPSLPAAPASAPAPAPASSFQSQFTPHHTTTSELVIDEMSTKPLQKLDVINNENSTTTITTISSHSASPPNYRHNYSNSYNNHFQRSCSSPSTSHHHSPSSVDNTQLSSAPTELHQQHQKPPFVLPPINSNNQRQHRQHPKHSIQFAII